MKYVNQTKWFHKDGVPTAEVLHASMTSGPPFKGILSVTWLIDSHIQGSIIIYESEEAEKKSPTHTSGIKKVFTCFNA